MVVVHRAHGFRFVIYTLDHERAHVHVTGAGQAKIDLIGRGGGPELTFTVGIKKPDVKRLMDIAVERREFFLRECERIHGRSDGR